MASARSTACPVTVLEMPGLALGAMGNWLAAAGILRMLSRADAGARLHWEADIPVITTSLPAPERDLADRIPFAPVITPWQAGGGWGPKDKGSAGRLEAIRSSRSPRLAPLRRAIAAADQIMEDHEGEPKAALVLHLRNRLPGDALPWLDAAVPLKPADGPERVAVAAAPLAGSGGNDARWDLSSNYHAAILALHPDREPEPGGATADPSVIRRRGLLDDLVNGTQYQPVEEMSSGPYWPDATAAGLANPWALVFLAEGLCAFGDAPAREFAAPRQPWASRPGPGLYAGESPGEAWLPLWGKPASMAEVAVLLGGPQPRWRRSGAATAAEMHESFAAGKWPRGVTGFARYGLARRRGHGHVAVPLDLLTPQNAPSLAEVLDSVQAAKAAGVGESTWRAYVARGQAPAPDARDLRTGRPGWHAATIGAWLAVRPGQGARTDKA